METYIFGEETYLFVPWVADEEDLFMKNKRPLLVSTTSGDST